MVSALLSYAPGAGVNRTGGHPKVTIISETGNVVVTLDTTNPETELTDIADQWLEQDRPGLEPVLQRAGKRLSKFNIEAIVGGTDPTRDVSGMLHRLSALAKFPQRVTVSLTPGDQRSAATRGGWVITNLSWRVLRRRHGDNAVVRARVTIELTAGGTKPGGVVQPGSAPAPPAAPAPTAAPATRRHTVRQGETLIGIGRSHYPNDPNAWQRIAQANGVTDPRKLRVGQVLVLP